MASFSLRLVVGSRARLALAGACLLMAACDPPEPPPGDPLPGDPPAGDEDGGVADAGGPVRPGDAGHLVATADAGSASVPLVAPVVTGEPFAGHLRPAFHWDAPAGTASFSWRIDDEPWLTGPGTTTRWAPPTDLAPGAHTLQVTAKDAAGTSSQPGTFTTTIEVLPAQGFFDATARTLPKTARGHTAAVSAHNCYQDNQADSDLNEQHTEGRIDVALARGADFIELDVKEDQGLRVAHYDFDARGALLANVLDHPALAASDVVMFLELKEVSPTAAMATQLLDLLLERRHVYARNGRPVFLRAFTAVGANIDLLAAAIQDERYDFIRPYVKFSTLLEIDVTRDVFESENRIIDAASRGMDMIELSLLERSLFPKILLARELGLGVNVFIVGGARPFGEAAALREDVDVFTSDYDVSALRADVGETGGLFYLNPFDQAGGSVVAFERRPGNAAELDLGASPAPTFVPAAPEQHGHAALAFDAEASEQALLVDAPAGLAGDLVVAIVARFDATGMAPDARMPLMSGGEPAGPGWALEVVAPEGGGPGVPTFTVRDGAVTASASLPATSLDPVFAHLFIATYFGGEPYLYIDFRDDGETSTGLLDAARDVAPIVLGGSGGPAHFDGVVQMATATIHDVP